MDLEPLNYAHEPLNYAHDSPRDYDSKPFFKLMVESGFVHDEYRMSWVFELGHLEVHVMEADVLYVYDEESSKPGEPLRIMLQEHETIEGTVRLLCNLLVNKVISA